MNERQQDLMEEAAMARALELLEAGEAPAPSEADFALLAEHLDTWTALPHLLEPVTPRPEIKEALLRAVAEQQAAAPMDASVDAPVVLFRKPERTNGAPAHEPPTHKTPARRSPARWSPAYWALAATLAAAVLGLSLFSWNLNQKVLRLGEEIAHQDAAFGELLLPAHLGHQEAELTATDFTYPNLPAPTFEKVALRESLFLPVTHGPHQDDRQDGVHGAILVCSKHRRWLLSLQGLLPLQGEQQYHLWFVTENGPVHVGPMKVEGDHSAVASSDRIPASVLGLLVSREGGGAIGAQPAGPIFAEAHRPVEI